MAKSWFSVGKKNESTAEISIYSEIGGFGVTAADFRESLLGLGKPERINLFISSDGGDIAAGFAIYNMLERHAAWKHVTIDGLAASMASVIAMAGDEIVMPANSMLMIHNPFGVIGGGSDQIISFGKALAAMRNNIISAYAKRTGLDRDRIAGLMDAETWLDAEESVALGFANEIGAAQAMAARFDISRFSNVPAAFGRTMRTLAMTKHNPKAKADDGDELQTAEEIRANLLAQQAEVRTLCKIAGHPELADKFIEDDTSPEDVRTELLAQQEETAKKAAKRKTAAKTGAVDLSTHNQVEGDEEVSDADDPKPVKLDAAKIWNRFNRKVA